MNCRGDKLRDPLWKGRWAFGGGDEAAADLTGEDLPKTFDLQDRTLDAVFIGASARLSRDDR
jgi:hypothetical protein